MATNSFRCRLVTPAARLLDEPVESATVPLWDGLMGFLPGRAPILGKLGCGELQLSFAPDASTKAEGGVTSYYVDGGVLEMKGNELTILAERATPVREIVLSDAQAALAKAEREAISLSDPDREVKTARREREMRGARERIRLAKARGSI